MKNRSKKLLSILLVCCLCATGVFSAGAADTDWETGWQNTARIGEDTYVNMIRNEFYQLYADQLLTEVYGENQNLIENGRELSFALEEKIAPALLQEMKASEADYYLTIVFQAEEPFSKEANEALLERLDGIDEVLYVASEAPAAIVLVQGGDAIDQILADPQVAYVTASFETIGASIAVIPEWNHYTFQPSSGDARAILRYAVGLGAPDFTYRSDAKKFFFSADTDFDGAIQSDDARTALRIAVGLDTGVTFYVSTDSFWDR